MLKQNFRFQNFYWFIFSYFLDFYIDHQSFVIFRCFMVLSVLWSCHLPEGIINLLVSYPVITICWFHTADVWWSWFSRLFLPWCMFGLTGKDSDNSLKYLLRRSIQSRFQLIQEEVVSYQDQLLTATFWPLFLDQTPRHIVFQVMKFMPGWGSFHCRSSADAKKIKQETGILCDYHMGLSMSRSKTQAWLDCMIQWFWESDFL